MAKEGERMSQKECKSSKVMVVSVLSEYSLSEVKVSQFTAALNQNIYSLFIYTETATGALVKYYCTALEVSTLFSPM